MKKREMKIDQQCIDKKFTNWGAGTIAKVEDDYVVVYFPRRKELKLEIQVKYFQQEYKHLKRYPEFKHKGIKVNDGWVYDYCSGLVTSSGYSLDWDEVSCRNCLQKRKKTEVRGSQRSV
jgi:hypothetical protein